LKHLDGKSEEKKGLEKPWLRLEDDINFGVKISDEWACAVLIWLNIGSI
jgi:hypothetical protein